MRSAIVTTIGTALVITACIKIVPPQTPQPPAPTEFALTVVAQNRETAQPIGNARVRIDGAAPSAGVTASNGEYVFRSLKSAGFNLNVEADGYENCWKPITETVNQTQTCDMLAKPVVPTPTPVPAPVPTPEPVPPPAKDCASNDALAVIRCVREDYPDHMSPEQAVEFLKKAAFNLNRGKVPGGPYGILRKVSGNQCGGYSCDIICAGQGDAQRQHDVLIDERIPTWGAPMTAPGIRQDVCEIQPAQ